MNKLFLKSKFKKIVIGIVLAAFLSNPFTTMAQPKGGGFFGFVVKTGSFMVKERIKDNKKKEAEKFRNEKIEERERLKEDKQAERKGKLEILIADYNMYFQHMNYEDLVGLSNLLDQMLDGYTKDVTDLSDAQLKARIRARLKNKRLTQKHHKDLKEYVEKRMYLNKIFNEKGQGYITISPGGSIIFTSPAAIFAY